MVCNKCGSNNPDNSPFCAYCGNALNPNNTVPQNTGFTYDQGFSSQPQNVNPVGMDTPKKGEGLGTASLVLGIITLVAAFIFNIFVIPIGIVGLILGIVNKAQGGKKIAGIIMNIIGIIASVIILFVYVVLLAYLGFNIADEDFDVNDIYSETYTNVITTKPVKKGNDISGNYNCTGVDSNKDEYIITLNLKEDNTFLYGPYGRLTDNYAKGTYTYTDEQKTDNSGNYKYYMVELKGNAGEFVVDGEPNDTAFNSKMEFGITSKDNKKQGVIIFTNSYNMYYCYEQ